MRRLSVTYVGAPDEASPLGATCTETYDNVIGYSFYPDDQTLVVEQRIDGTKRRITYPQSKVIRTTFINP